MNTIENIVKKLAESRMTEAGDSEYMQLKRAYQDADAFEDFDGESGQIEDLTNDLKNKGIPYEIYKHKTDKGCTVFHDSIEIKENVKIEVGTTFENAGFDWEILVISGEYALVHAKDKRFHPYAVVWKIDPRDGAWAQGHYFSTESEASRYLKSK